MAVVLFQFYIVQLRLSRANCHDCFSHISILHSSIKTESGSAYDTPLFGISILHSSIKTYTLSAPLLSEVISILHSSIKTYTCRGCCRYWIISILHSSIKTPVWRPLFTYAKRFQFYIVQLRRIQFAKNGDVYEFQFYIVQLRPEEGVPLGNHPNLFQFYIVQLRP